MKTLFFFFALLPFTLIAAELRTLSTDRPNKTESPISLDQGHFMVESDLVNFTENRDPYSSTLNVLKNNYKYGLTHDSDLQIISPSWVKETTTGPDGEEKEGYGDTIVRFKKNLFGNDGGDAAFALLPFVKVPTAGADLGNRRVEGGIALPLSVSLPRGFSLGAQMQFEHLRRSDDRGAQTDYVMSLTLERNLTDELKGFVEFWNRSSDNSADGANSTLDVGVLYLVSPNIQLDAGAFFGLTDAADDVTTFLGLSIRI